jgi:hypothetical protein
MERPASRGLQIATADKAALERLRLLPRLRGERKNSAENDRYLCWPTPRRDFCRSPKRTFGLNDHYEWEEAAAIVRQDLRFNP